jgi:hypothetical protein
VKCKGVRLTKPAAAGRSTPEPPGQSLAPFLTRAGAPPLVLTPGTNFTIGRSPECSFSIPSKRVSRVHAEIRWQGETPVLVDRDSANGVYANGKRIKEAPLSSGDEIEIGPFLCVYRFGDPEEAKAESGEISKTMADKGDVLGGRITESGLAEILQSLEFNTKTGTLSVFARSFSGWITIENGVPGAAESVDPGGDRGSKTDVEAVMELLTLKEGHFSFAPELRTPEKRIRASITGLLLEWGRRADESAGASAPVPEEPPLNVDTPTTDLRRVLGEETHDDDSGTKKAGGFDFP